MPRVSVLMPAYNAAPYVAGAVESVLAQTYGDFEFVIIDVGSTDATPDILADYAARDHRIRLARNEANLGLIRSLNRGLEIARGEFVARFDADDLSRPERLERQVSFFNGNPDHVLVGASYDAIDSQGRVLWSKVTELDDVQVRWIARFRIPPQPGLEIARGEFVARFDADDLSRPERLERQVSFFNGNPDHVLVGASYDAIDSQGRVLWSKVTELDDVQVRWIARFRIPLGHSGAMFRRLDEVVPLVELSVV